jgi:hypothetical protein
MPPLDTRIPLMAVQPRRNSLTEQYGQAMNMKAMQQQMAAQEQALTDATARKNALKTAWGPEGLDYEAAQQALVGLGDVLGAVGLRGQALKEEEAKATQQSRQLKANMEKVNAISQLLGGAKSQEEWDSGLRRIQSLGITPDDVPATWSPEVSQRILEQSLDAKSRLQMGLEREKMANTEAYRGAQNDLAERRTAAYERGASQTNINMPGQLSARPLTPEEVQAFNIPQDVAPYLHVNAKGDIARRPLGPGEEDAGKLEVDAQAQAATNAKALALYEAARQGLDKGLSGAPSGPIAGRMPAITSEQQIADASIAAMAPALKQLFRAAGEGVFTDRDQQILLDMIPSRQAHPEARKAILENIDRIVRAKLGVEGPGQQPSGPKKGDVVNGYRYRGGPPASPGSWVRE